MAGQETNWWRDEIETADLMWCAAHLRHIMAPKTNVSPEAEIEDIKTSQASNTGDSVTNNSSHSSSIPQERYTQPEVLPVYPKYKSEPVEAGDSKDLPKEPASPLKVPDPFPFPDAREINRAVSPISKQVRGRIKNQLDIDRTAIATAEANGIPIPVFTAPLERMYELHLIIDRSPSMEFWGDLAVDATSLFRWQGIFRDLSVWQLETEEADNPKLFCGKGRIERDIRCLSAPGQNRLVVILTDTLGMAWQSGKAFELLGGLGEIHPVHIAHIFPNSLWSSTALSPAILRPLVAAESGCSNKHLKVEGRLRRKREPLYRFPIFNLSAQHMSNWAKHLAAVGGNAIQGVLIGPNRNSDLLDGQSFNTAETEEVDVLDYFWSYASREARELAGILAALPAIPPVMRLAQKKFLGQSHYWHLAEVFFSGLLKKSKLGPSDAAVNESFYDFEDGIRERLLADSPLLQTISVAEELGDFIEQEYGFPRSFGALIPDKDGRLEHRISAEQAYFAKVRGTVLMTVGGDLAIKGRALLQGVHTFEQSLEHGKFFAELGINFESFSFSVAELVDLESISFLESEFEVATIDIVFDEVLQDFEFNIATIHQEGSDWAITRQPSTAKQFIEPLEENISLEMVAIPGGTFVMGSLDKEPERYDDESPQHEVTIEPFFFGKYPVTQKQWLYVAQKLPQIDRKLSPSPSRFEGEALPVESVSWEEAVEFCKRLSRATERGYRLPSEAEWEYACRAGTITPFYFGQTISQELANYDGNYSYANGPKDDYREMTNPVGLFGAANAFGLFDMHGNVWEWCADLWHENYEGAPPGGTPWNDGEDTRRVLRGGSWYDYPGNCRSACRGRFNPDYRHFNYGFRVACSPASGFSPLRS